MRMDAAQEAAKLAQVYEGAVRAILEAHPERYESLSRDLHSWVQSALADGADMMVAIRKRAILAEREPLLEASFSGTLDVAGQARLDALDSELEQMERVEADQSEQAYASSRGGRIEAALDRLESMLNSAN